MNESNSENSSGSELHEQTLSSAIDLYETVRVQASRRLSFAPRGDNGLADNSGRISSASRSEIFDGCHQRLTFVLQLLVDHSELPDNIHELHSRESLESQLVGTICTALFTWMLADVIELLNGGDIHTAGQAMRSLLGEVGGQSTSRNTSSRNRPPLQNLRSMSTPARLRAAAVDSAPEPPASTRPAKKKKRTTGSKALVSKSRKGKKSPSAKKKGKRSKKRSVRKRRS